MFSIKLNRKIKMGKYTITLIEDYRSYPIKSKPVRCIENGKIFNSAMQAVKWLSEFGIECNYKNANKIKKICKGLGRTEKAFGFHWNYVNNSDREFYNVKKNKPKRWLYYATLKSVLPVMIEENTNQEKIYSKSYKLNKELLKTLQNELDLIVVR